MSLPLGTQSTAAQSRLRFPGQDFGLQIWSLWSCEFNPLCPNADISEGLNGCWNPKNTMTSSALIDSMDRNTAPEAPFVYVSSDGMFNDENPAKVVSSCNLNIYTFPFDIQNCTLTFNSYSILSESSAHILHIL